MRAIPDDEPWTPGEPKQPIIRRPMTPVEKRMSEDLHWAAQAPEVQQHVGKVVAVRNKRVIAVGDSRDDVLARAAAQEGCEPWEFVVEIVPDDEIWEASD